MKSEFIEIVSSTGEILSAERHEQLIPVGEIVHSPPRFQDFCRSCPRFGKNLARPPHSPAFPDFLGKARTARVICFRVPLATSGSTNLDQQRAGLRQTGRLLSVELKRHRE